MTQAATPARIARFMTAAREHFERHDSPIARQIAGALALAPSQPPALKPAKMPACNGLLEMFSGAPDDLSLSLQACVDDLHWRMAGFGKLAAGADQKLAVTELIGPDGMFRRHDVRIGVLIQRERFRYPRHWHAAEELYLILSGTARWAVDDEQPSPRAPGTFVHHASLQPHTMVTESETMIALWGWAGDIGGASYAV